MYACREIADVQHDLRKGKPVSVGAVRLLCFAWTLRSYGTTKRESILVTAAYRSTVQINVENLLASSLKSSGPDLWHTDLDASAGLVLSRVVPAPSPHHLQCCFPISHHLWLRPVSCVATSSTLQKYFICWISELVGGRDIVRSDATEVVGMCSWEKTEQDHPFPPLLAGRTN